MLIIKAYNHAGQTNIYEATEIRIGSNKRYLEFIRPGTGDLVETLLLSDEGERDFSSIYIENERGKTIESLR